MEVVAEATDGMHDNEQDLFEAIKAGASGFVLKSAVDRDPVEACRAAMRGEPFLYPGGVRALMREYIERARAGEAVGGEDLPILAMLLDGATPEEIAGSVQRDPGEIAWRAQRIVGRLCPGLRHRPVEDSADGLRAARS